MTPSASDIDAMTARGWTWNAEFRYFHAFGLRDDQDRPILSLRVWWRSGGGWVADYGVPDIDYGRFERHPSPLLAADEAEAWLRGVLEPFRFGWLAVGGVPLDLPPTPE